MKPSGIGGQAVIEGVMMRNQDDYAIAVRKPDQSIIVKKDKFVSKTRKHKLYKLPILRGIVSFIESLVMGVQVLTYSASFYEDEEESEPTKFEKALSKIFKDKAESVVMGLTVATSLILSVAIFIILPYFIAELIAKNTGSTTIVTLIEGVLRIIIFVAYIVLISKLEDIQRLFAYHGAEHKAINCIENGNELTIENVRKESTEHKRCGTSFTFIVMVISIIFFMFVRVETIWLRVLFRLLLVPIISGVAYEFLKLAGRSDSVLIQVLSKPGLLLQRFTTREPDDDMIEIAIESVEAVFDWKAFIAGEEIEDKIYDIEYIDTIDGLAPNLKKSEVSGELEGNEMESQKGETKVTTHEDKVLDAIEQIVSEY